MKESVDSVFHLNKSTGICKFYNFAVNLCSDRVFFCNCVPRILCRLLDSKRNTSGLNIIAENHAFDFIADLDHVRRLVDFLCPAEFRNMGKTLDSLFQFDECSEVCEFCNCSLNDIIYMIFFFEVNPRIFAEVFERKIDSFFCRIKADNFELNLLSFLYEILRAGNVTPAHIVDMKKSVETAEINESSEACKALYSSLYGVTDLGVCKESIAALLD